MSVIWQSRGKLPVPNWIFATLLQTTRSLFRRLANISRSRLARDALKEAESIAGRCWNSPIGTDGNLAFFDAFPFTEFLTIQRPRTAAAVLPDQHDVPDVDDGRQRLSENDHRLALDDAVDQRHQPAPHRAEPERHRHHAVAGTLACDPLHEESRGEEQLRDEAEREPEVELGDEDVVEIVVERLPVLNEHHCTS